MTSKRKIKQAAATLRKELGRNHANRVGKQAIEEAAVGVAANPASLNEVVQWLKVQPKPPTPKSVKVGFAVFAALLTLWLFSGNDDQPSTRQASASSNTKQGKAKPAKVKLTVAQDLAAAAWADATADQYKEYCRKGRCTLGGFVLATSKDKGRAVVTLGKLGKQDLRYRFALRNPKTLGQFKPNYLAGGLICKPPRGKQPAFRDCRINPDHGAPYDLQELNSTAKNRAANRKEHRVIVESYEGNMLFGYRDLPFVGRVSKAFKVNNIKSAGRVPRGWTAHLVCFDKTQTRHTGSLGTVMINSDCNQLGGARP